LGEHEGSRAVFVRAVDVFTGGDELFDGVDIRGFAGGEEGRFCQRGGGQKDERQERSSDHIGKIKLSFVLFKAEALVGRAFLYYSWVMTLADRF
jgi:hypothetical protein